MTWIGTSLSKGVTLVVLLSGRDCSSLGRVILVDLQDRIKALIFGLQSASCCSGAH